MVRRDARPARSQESDQIVSLVKACLHTLLVFLQILGEGNRDSRRRPCLPQGPHLPQLWGAVSQAEPEGHQQEPEGHQQASSRGGAVASARESCLSRGKGRQLTGRPSWHSPWAAAERVQSQVSPEHAAPWIPRESPPCLPHASPRPRG